MGQLNVSLPETLHRRLHSLAKFEGVPLEQFVIYSLTRHTENYYFVEEVDEFDLDQQNRNAQLLVQKLGIASSEEIQLFMDTREPTAPEDGLTPEIVAKLKQRIQSAKETIV